MVCRICCVLFLVFGLAVGFWSRVTAVLWELRTVRLTNQNDQRYLGRSFDASPGAPVGGTQAAIIRTRHPRPSATTALVLNYHLTGVGIFLPLFTRGSEDG